MKYSGLILACILGSISLCTGAYASQLVYHPASPTFGGNPLNGTFLLSQAQAQGAGAQSGQQSPDLSGLTNALSNIGTGSSASPVVIVQPTTNVPANP